jgi:RpiR family transcriptional regulator, glv operon transcriptional regulator
MTIEQEVIKNFSKLNETDLIIWKYINKNRCKLKQMTITELANNTNVSRTTISRFVNKIGLNGYSELKVRLNLELEKQTFNIEDYTLACDSLTSYIETLKYTDFKEESELLFNAERIFIYGTGDIQLSVAEQLKRMFLSGQELVYIISGKTFDDSIFDIFKENDVLIIISLSGNNEQALKIAKMCQIKGTKIISITEFKNNKLSTLSDKSIYIHSPEIKFLESFPNYRITTMFYVLAEMFFIRYSIYKNERLAETKI